MIHENYVLPVSPHGCVTMQILVLIRAHVKYGYIEDF